jgi:hypothetical protein
LISTSVSRTCRQARASRLARPSSRSRPNPIGDVTSSPRGLAWTR